MKQADYIVDIGPYAGILGGEIIAQGNMDTIKNNNNSLTGKYLSKTLRVNDTMYNNLENNKFLTIQGVCCNNLRRVTANFRLNTLNVVTGVSGSGKSSLIIRTLEPLLVYIFDEPTNGLHFHDVKQLLTIFDKLLKAGHTLIVIEHNLDVIKSAGWIVDMGPEGGKDGGKVIIEGTLKEVINSRESLTGRAIKQVEN